VLDYWLGDPPELPGLNQGKPALAVEAGDWWVYPESGIGICESGFWFLRWDLSPLGYLRTAAHGHLDALHLSIWHRGVALVIDPGTGAYYGDRELRARLAARAAHNGPCPVMEDGPRRLGPFLWSEQHPPPSWEIRDVAGSQTLRGELRLKDGTLARSIRRLTTPDGWEVTDEYARGARQGRFRVMWQFGPGSVVQQLTERRYRVRRGETRFDVEVSEGWSTVECVETSVSPAFRQVTQAPGLLFAAPDRACVLTTRFLACDEA
jgi:hypothetical protein